MALNLVMNEIHDDDGGGEFIGDDDDDRHGSDGVARQEKRREESLREIEVISPFFPPSDRKRRFDEITADGGIDRRHRGNNNNNSSSSTEDIRSGSCGRIDNDVHIEMESLSTASLDSTQSAVSCSSAHRPSTGSTPLTDAPSTPEVASIPDVPSTPDTASTPVVPSTREFSPTSLAFMCFKEEVLEAFRQLGNLENREKELLVKLKSTSEALSRSEERRRALSLEAEAKEDEATEKIRKCERDFINKLEDDKIRLRKMSLELNVASKSRDAVKSELDALKVSFRELTVSSNDVESKLKHSARLKDFQTKRIEVLESNNERLVAAGETLKANEKTMFARVETTRKWIDNAKEDLKAAEKRSEEMEAKVEESRAKISRLESELRDARERIEESRRKEKRERELRTADAERSRAQIEKWKKTAEEKEKDAEDLQKRLENLLETIKTQMEMRAELGRCVEEARTTCVRMDVDLMAARRRAEEAEEEIATKTRESKRNDASAAEEAKKTAEKIRDLETEIAKGKEEAAAAAESQERNQSYVEALKNGSDAKEKVLKRTEEKYRAEAAEWKEKEACFEAQLLEMRELREKCDQFTTIDYNFRDVEFYGGAAARREKGEGTKVEERDGEDDRMDSRATSSDATDPTRRSQDVVGSSFVDESNDSGRATRGGDGDGEVNGEEVRHRTSRSLLFSGEWRCSDKRLAELSLQDTKIEVVDESSS